MIRRFSQWMVFIISIISVSAIAFYIQHAIEAQVNRPELKKEEIHQQHPDVSVITSRPGSYHAVIKAYGGVHSHFELTLVSPVTGQVEALDAGFETGKRMKKGSLMARLDETNYRSAVKTAERTLSDARLSLLEEERQALQAWAEWKSSGIKGEPASDLVLHKPQVAAAGLVVEEALAVLESARKDLEQTCIRVPFDALVVERLVAPGSFVQAGTSIATLYSTDRVEIAVSLSESDWSNLPDSRSLNNKEWPVDLYNAQTGQNWSGYVLRLEQHLDEQTRQRNLILAIDYPLDSEPSLLPGMFVQATIKGRSVNDLWRLPSSAFSQKGEIWYVTKDNTLASFSAEPLFSDGDAVYIDPPDKLAILPVKVLVHPLNNYLTGMVVNPVEKGDAS